MAEVSGVVKLDGEPAPDLIVEFLPDPDHGTHGPRSTGTTNQEGQFRLVCDDQRPGAVVGFHRVIIQDARTFPDSRADRKAGRALVIPPSRIGDRYRKAKDTPLRQEVKDEPQSVTLEVTSR